MTSNVTTNLVADYGWTTGNGPQSCGYIAPAVLRILKGLAVRRVLDLGAGNGVLCGLLAAEGYQPVGVEYDAQGVAIARAAYPGIAFHHYGVQDDPAHLRAQEPAFDAVVSTEVIEHLFSPHLLPQYAGGVLKPGGYLVLTTPFHGYLKNLALALLGQWDKHFTVLWHGGHIKFWSRATLTELLAQNGFEVVDFTGVGRMPYLWKSMVVVAKQVGHADSK